MLFALSLLSFGGAWWMGLYLIARDPYKPLLRRAGLGLITYALALAAGLLHDAAPAELRGGLLRAYGLLVMLPAVLWAGALALVLPEAGGPGRAAADRLWRLLLLPATLAGLAAAAALGVSPGEAGYLALAALAVAPLGALLTLLVRARRAIRPTGALGLLTAGTLFFGLGLALLLLPLRLPGGEWAILGIGVDVALLGLAVALWDAFEEGESLRRDMLRSLLAALGAALLFGGQVGIALAAGAGAALPMTALLLATLAAAVAAATLGGPIQALLDRLAFPSEPALQRARAELRASEAALPKLQPTPALAELDEAEFARLTRRALSHYGDLARLAASPLTQLPQVERRLAERGVPDQPVERAAELQSLLGECIARLRPRDGGAFGTSDAWRYYNVLYFPYVAGVRPYRRRGDADALDEPARQALAWFDAQVPERTLHNWQNAAARLVAQDLRHGVNGG